MVVLDADSAPNSEIREIHPHVDLDEFCACWAGDRGRSPEHDRIRGRRSLGQCGYEQAGEKQRPDEPQGKAGLLSQVPPKFLMVAFWLGHLASH